MNATGKVRTLVYRVHHHRQQIDLVVSRSAFELRSTPLNARDPHTGLTVALQEIAYSEMVLNEPPRIETPGSMIGLYLAFAAVEHKEEL